MCSAWTRAATESVNRWRDRHLSVLPRRALVDALRLEGGVGDRFARHGAADGVGQVPGRIVPQHHPRRPAGTGRGGAGGQGGSARPDPLPPVDQLIEALKGKPGQQGGPGCIVLTY